MSDETKPGDYGPLRMAGPAYALRTMGIASFMSPQFPPGELVDSYTSLVGLDEYPDVIKDTYEWFVSDLVPDWERVIERLSRFITTPLGSPNGTYYVNAIHARPEREEYFIGMRSDDGRGTQDFCFCWTDEDGRLNVVSRRKSLYLMHHVVTWTG